MLEVGAAREVPEDLVAVGVPVLAVGDGAETGTRVGAGRAPGAPEGAPGDAVRKTAESGDRRFELTSSLRRLGAGAAGVASALLPDDVDEDWLRRQGFKAKPGQSLVLRSGAGAPSVVLLGLGPRERVDAEGWRLAAAALVRAGGEGGGTAAVLLPDDPPGGDHEHVGAALAEGAILAAYRFDEYRTSPDPAGLDRMVVLGGTPAVGDDADGPLSRGIRRGVAAATAACFGRDLVNTPAGDLTPRRLAERVVERLSGLPRTTVEAWDEGRISAERLGGLQAVARGSAEPPRLVRATYEPADGADAPHVVLVGKGITFDSGGLSLKPSEGMMTMKTDMSGAAVVLSVVSACAALDVPVRVTAIAPVAENMPGAAAQKPGDVFTARNGLTVEVLNTDAEGRLVLADGLSLAAELSPDAIVDVATLTGAQVVALGTGVAALLGNDEPLVDRLREAGTRAGERLWPLPLPEDYSDHIRSEIADMKNIGRSREAGTIAAAMLLARFVGEVPWAHLDIAGPARSSEASGYLQQGATAFGVRALLEFLAAFGR